MDRPNYQALAASAVAGGEDSRHTCHELAVLCLGIGARIALDTELGQHRVLRPQKTHRKQHQFGLQDFLGIQHALWNEGALLVSRPFHFVNVQFLDVAISIADKFFARG